MALILKNTVLLCLASSLLLSGCNGGTPECNSDTAKDEVIKMALGRVSDDFRLKLEEPGNSLSIINVRTTSHTSSPDINECAADIREVLSGKSYLIPITNRLQNTDDGKQFYISVSGL